MANKISCRFYLKVEWNFVGLKKALGRLKKRFFNFKERFLQRALSIGADLITIYVFLASQHVQDTLALGILIGIVILNLSRKY